VTGTKITVAPPDNFSGEVDLTYTVIDAQGRQADATLTVFVKGVPLAPSQPQVVAGDSSADVSWNAPAPNGVPVDYYTVAIAGGPTQNQVTDISTTFDNLNNGTAYTVTVTACHVGWGCSAASPPSNPFTPDAPPSTPTNFTATRGDGNVQLAWQPGPNNGTSITGYQIDCDACGNSPQTFDPAVTTYDWPNLTNGTTYTFNIVAEKTLASTHKLVESDPASQSAKPAGKPGTPTVNPPGQRPDGTITDTWNQPEDHGEPIDNYTVRVVDATTHNPVNAATCNTDNSAMSTVCTNIAKGTQIEIGVTAHNAVGDGPEGLSPAQVAATTPSTPAIVTIQGQGDHAILTVATSDDGGVNITDYDVQRDGTDLGHFGPSTTINAATPIGATYTFTVTATNQANFTSGTSQPSRSVKGQGQPILNYTSNHSGNTLNYTWNIDAQNSDNVTATLNGTAVPLNSSHQDNVSCGQTTTPTLTVNYQWDGQPQNPITQTQSQTADPCPPPQTVSIYKGPAGSVQGECTVNCNWIVIQVSNFPANTPITVTCFDNGSSYFYWSESGSSIPNTPDRSAHTDGGGSYSTSSSTGKDGSGFGCIDGQGGHTIQVVVNGVTSNSYTQ
jgi:large repetitive protein